MITPSVKRLLLLWLPFCLLLPVCVQVPTDHDMTRSVFRTVPLPPDTVIASELSVGLVQVSWAVPPWASRYRLYYTEKDSIDSAAVMIDTIAIPFYRISGLVKDRKYVFAVEASNELGRSGKSPLTSLTVRADTVPRGMKRIPAGIFQMGSTEGYDDEIPVHPVILPAFYMDSTEVLRSDYDSLLHRNLNFNRDSVRAPAENLTWFDAILYCNARSRQAGLDTAYAYDSAVITPAEGCVALSNLAIRYGRRAYRLPTEAEWEYACRAGTVSESYWGEAITRYYAHFYAYSSDDPPREDSISENVAQRFCNGYGLYDMNGNVREWCNDRYDQSYYTQSPRIQPVGPTSAAPGDYRVCRGGSSADYEIKMTSSYRMARPPTWRLSILGFRAVLPAP